MSKIRQGSSLGKITAEYSLRQVAEKSNDDVNGRFVWANPGNNHHESRWQHEFYWSGSPNKYKYVNQLWNLKDGWFYRLYLVVKLEWLGHRSNKWKEASENRYVTVNVVCTVQLLDGQDGIHGATYLPIYINKTQSLNLWILLKQDYLTYSNYAYWDIDMQGNISQQVTVDPNSVWNISGTLW